MSTQKLPKRAKFDDGSSTSKMTSNERKNNKATQASRRQQRGLKRQFDAFYEKST